MTRALGFAGGVLMVLTFYAGMAMSVINTHAVSTPAKVMFTGFLIGAALLSLGLIAMLWRED